MSGKNINFDNKGNLKSDFYKKKTVNKIDNADVNKVLVSNEEPYGTKNSFKYFIRYNDNDFIMPLCIKLPQRLVMLKNLRVIQQCPLKLVTNNC